MKEATTRTTLMMARDLSNVGPEDGLVVAGVGCVSMGCAVADGGEMCLRRKKKAKAMRP